MALMNRSWVKGKPKSVLQLARTEQKAYRKLTGPEARKRLNNKEFDELQKAKLRVFKKLAKRIESDVKIDPTHVRVPSELLIA